MKRIKGKLTKEEEEEYERLKDMGKPYSTQSVMVPSQSTGPVTSQATQSVMVPSQSTGPVTSQATRARDYRQRIYASNQGSL